MRRVLVIAYLFPPLGGGGVQRTLGFVRHLPANGWRPTVICADDDAPYWARDPQLVHRVPHEATIVRVPAGWPGAFARLVRRTVPHGYRAAFDRAFFVPDRQAPWGPKALQAALRLAQESRFAALYSTGSPWTNHLVAAALKVRTGLPWVADFRDPWTQNMTFSPASYAHRALHRRLENLVYQRADRIVANTPGHMRSVQAAFAASYGKISFIPNGYAESDFATPRAARLNRKPLLLGYAGSFYPGQGPAALLELFRRVRGIAPPFRLRFMGNTNLGDLPAQVGLGDVVEELGYLSQADMLDQLGQCHAGWIATVDWGTATSPMYQAHDAGIPIHVWVDETRPRNQGALTAWELGSHGIPHTYITDNAGGHLMQHGQVDLVITGTDRTTRQGDVCNKIGTYLKALAARDNGVPFYVALPSPTIDWTVTDGVAEIPIEERDPRETTHIMGKTDSGQIGTVQVSPDGSPGGNPAFDVTPNRLVTGLITERGICAASAEGLASLFPEFTQAAQ